MIAAAYRLALRLAAAIGSGMFVPMGFEYAARRPFDAALGGPEDLRRARDEAPARSAARLPSQTPWSISMAEYQVDGEMRQLTDAQDAVTALLRSNAPDMRLASRARAGAGQSGYRPRSRLSVCRFRLCRHRPAPRSCCKGRAKMPMRRWAGRGARLAYAPTRPVIHPLVRDEDLHPSRMAAPRIGIEAVLPQVPDGAFAVKRLVGERVAVSADIIADGHEVLAAELLWAADDEAGLASGAECSWW